MKLGIRAKLFLVSLGLIAASLAVAHAYLERALDRLLVSRIRSSLLVEAALVAGDAGAATAAPDDLATWDALADVLGSRGRARVTLIRRDGVVVGDSQVGLDRLHALDNHGARPEVAAALGGERAASVRDSRTVGHRLMYVAVPFFQHGRVAGVARLALPLTEIDQAVSGLRRVLLVGLALSLLLAVLMASIAAHVMSRSLRRLTASARRMAEGDLSVRVRAEERDEIGQLGRVLDRLAENLAATLAALRWERDLLGHVLEGMQEGILLLDRQGRIALTNPALREMLLLGAEAVGKTVLEAVRSAELKECLARAASAADPLSVEVELGGMKPRRLLVHAAALAEEPGRILAVFVDVTDIRRLESLRRDFVANASHELRTPITAICSAAETLRSAAADPAASARFVAIIERNAARLRDLVEDILELSRIESREFRLDLAPIELSPLVAHVFSLHQDRAREKAITLGDAIPTGPVIVLADRRALEQVLSNLVDNAIKYCPPSSSVTVSAALSGERVELAVEDTGPGIERRHLPRLFERFYRVDPGRSREQGGTGLGLSIVKHLVEAMAGTVEVSSIVGRGTRFIVRLPAPVGATKWARVDPRATVIK